MQPREMKRQHPKHGEQEPDGKEEECALLH